MKNKSYDLKLYPLIYKGKKYKEKDCDDVFIAFYSCKEALNDNCGVYVSEGLWIYPDGEYDEW